jgi:predicted GIY-YIG superfamily endonuclease
MSNYKRSYTPKTNTQSNPTYVYSLNCANGKKYVGMTSDIDRRMDQHFSGNGAQWTQKNQPVSINHIQECTSKENAKKAERIVYENMRDYHGIDNVRGAGHTSSITK